MNTAKVKIALCDCKVFSLIDAGFPSGFSDWEPHFYFPIPIYNYRPTVGAHYNVRPVAVRRMIKISQFMKMQLTDR